MNEHRIGPFRPQHVAQTQQGTVCDIEEVLRRQDEEIQAFLK